MMRILHALLVPCVLAVLWLRMEASAPAPHWAYQPIPAVRVPSTNGLPTHPIDAFLRARLATSGLEPAPEADRTTLIRRVTFDLTGLPPTPDEVRRFLADESPDAWERLVDRLLASPRHGERTARHWMDVIHFAETHGHDQDRMRTNAWPYRDYLIESFNADKPYSRFIQEQVAGDVLFPNDPKATVALGFIAAGPWDESSLRDIREDTLDRQIARYVDRDDMLATVMSTVTSTTVHCARCHDHKFDPISQQDYYALQSVFAGVERANRTFDPDPALHVHRLDLRTSQRRVERREPGFLLSEDSRRETADWEAVEQRAAIPWSFIAAQTFVSAGGATLKRLPDQSLLASGTRPERDTYTLTATNPIPRITAIRLDVLADASLPQKGPGRADNGNLHLTEFQLLLFEPGSNQPRRIALTNANASFNQAEWTIAHSLDANEKTAWGIHPREGDSHQAVFELAEPLEPPPGSILTFVLQQLHGGSHLIGRFRLASTDQAPPVRAVRPLPDPVARALTLPPDRRTESEQLDVAAQAMAERLRSRLKALPPPSYIYAAAEDFEPDGGLKPPPAPREVRILRRGEITKPGELARPGALSCIAPLPARFDLGGSTNEGPRRAALAAWLTSPDNPLTWRSVVNRTWQQHFGRGLVDTPSDFGRMGSLPSHPELLDWLAGWFRDDAKGSLKSLRRLLVTSATYRQSTAPLPAALAVDADNRLLSHTHRTRLDAECVRDALLFASGRLDLRMGGPGDQQFDLQPGIHVTPRVDYTRFDIDSPAANRRSIYRFLFRTLPDPFFEALDCPAGDQLVAHRNNSVTVQQALALWNNLFVTRQSEHVAARLQKEHPALPEQVHAACQWLWGRPPQPDEARELAEFARQHGLANLARLLANSNEFVFVN